MKTLVQEYSTTYTDIKNIKLFCDNNNIDDWKEVAEELLSVNDDFEYNNYRFIRASKIDEIQEKELESDLYMLGCFTDWFIADNTSIPLKAVKALQESENYEALGEMMIDDIDNIQREYARLDGYGHHFNHYDGTEQEETFNGTEYYIFRTN